MDERRTVTLSDLDTAEEHRLARRVALLHGALLSITRLGPNEAHRAPDIARSALERPLAGD